MNQQQLHLHARPPFHRQRLHKGMYLLPSILTMGNILLGYLAISQTLQGTLSELWHFNLAAKAIAELFLFTTEELRL